MYITYSMYVYIWYVDSILFGVRYNPPNHSKILPWWSWCLLSPRQAYYTSIILQQHEWSPETDNLSCWSWSYQWVTRNHWLKCQQRAFRKKNIDKEDILGNTYQVIKVFGWIFFEFTADRNPKVLVLWCWSLLVLSTTTLSATTVASQQTWNKGLSGHMGSPGF